MDARLAKRIAAAPKTAWAIIRSEDDALAGALEKHAAEFAWAYFNYDGPAWGAEEFAKELAAITHEGLKRKRREDLPQLRTELEEKLALAGREARLFELARKTIMLKAKRKDVMFKSFYAAERPLAEIAARTGLTLKQVRFLLPEELPQAFTYGSKLAQKLDGRAEYCLILQTPQDLKLMEGLEAREFSKRIKTHEATGNETELHGQCACTGEATGAVCIVNVPGDMIKMRAGDVLVSVATTPDIVTAMRKASAIVSDMGGMTCHAAIVSRELGVPCVVGCRIATKALKDGDTVHVDATNGMVKILERCQAPDGN
ncbi:MAG: PEP-utilizing enzyme [Candidatus Micrarchaeota archaeon]